MKLPVLTLVLAFPAVASAKDLPRALADLTPGHFAERVEVHREPGASTLVLSTQPGYTRSREVRGAHADDVHLRAVIDEASGAVRWQVWHDLVHPWRRRDVREVRFHHAGVSSAVAPLLTQHKEDRCPPQDAPGSCNTLVRVVFEMPEQAVREIAAAYRPGQRKAWPVHFVDAQGKDVFAGLAPAEAAGLLHAVEAWKSERS